MRITLIFSIHEELGACNSQALLKIIEAIAPDVIFEELSESLYQQAYHSKTLHNLESVAIREYTSKCNIPHLPVDTYEKPFKYESLQNALFNRLFHGAGYESSQLRSFQDKVRSVIGKFGFHYLNDDANDGNFEELDALVQKVLHKLDDPELDHIFSLNQNVILNREVVILDNIYAHCKEHTVKNGLMLIGSGHRKSIMRKIEERKHPSDVPIHWQFYTDIVSKLQ